MTRRTEPRRPLGRSLALELLPRVFMGARRRRGVYPAMVRPDGGCWLWLGAIYTRGWGGPRMTVAYGVTYSVRYVVWLALRGPLPDSSCDVTPMCGMRECVAPDHLVVEVKGRAQVEMTDEEVLRIRTCALTMSQVRVAEYLGIDPVVVQHVVSGRRHPDGPWAPGYDGPAYVDGRTGEVRQTPPARQYVGGLR